MFIIEFANNDNVFIFINISFFYINKDIYSRINLNFNIINYITIRKRFNIIK